MQLTWKSILGFSDYEISSNGDIRSIDRVKKYKSGRTITLKGKAKKLRKHPKNGFLLTDLINNKGTRVTVYPHKCVALAFIPNKHPRKKKIVMHLDGDYSNNSIENLQWTTYSESFKLNFLTGKRDNSQLWEKRRLKYGAKGSSKTLGRQDPLTPENKKEIQSLRTQHGVTLKALSVKFGCSISHIHKTLNKVVEDKS